MAASDPFSLFGGRIAYIGQLEQRSFSQVYMELATSGCGWDSDVAAHLVTIDQHFSGRPPIGAYLAALDAHPEQIMDATPGQGLAAREGTASKQHTETLLYDIGLHLLDDPSLRRDVSALGLTGSGCGVNFGLFYTSLAFYLGSRPPRNAPQTQHVYGNPENLAAAEVNPDLRRPFPNFRFDQPRFQVYWVSERALGFPLIGFYADYTDPNTGDFVRIPPTDPRLAAAQRIIEGYQPRQPVRPIQNALLHLALPIASDDAQSEQDTCPAEDSSAEESP